MTGSVFYPLSQQIADTASVHGMQWALDYYLSKGVPFAELVILAGLV